MADYCLNMSYNKSQTASSVEANGMDCLSMDLLELSLVITGFGVAYGRGFDEYEGLEREDGRTRWLLHFEHALVCMSLRLRD